MNYSHLHPWELTIPQAKALQSELASRVVHAELPAQIRHVAGVDISGILADGDVLGSVVVLSYPALELVEVRTARHRPLFPYIPGYLSFRETPILLNAFDRLCTEPDVILVDGHGFAHPRRFGIACHLGLILGRPTIGCAKSVLVGKHGPLRLPRGATAPLLDKDEQIGLALRTREGIRPIYVSVGHKTTLNEAAKFVLSCAAGYRMPEPTRLAHHAANGNYVEGLAVS